MTQSSSPFELIDLAAERLGGAVIYANDDFFAEKENLLKPEEAVFIADKYTDRGKWMDGWESRRRRTPGHDFCLVRLGLPGVIRAIVVDTAFFRGNYPDHAAIEATSARADASPEALMGPDTRWVPILEKSALEGNSKNKFEIAAGQRFTHLRLSIFPDGGVARLRVHGEVVPDWRLLGRGRAPLDLAAIENGGLALSCSDMFFGERQNMLMPGRAPNMGDGWETRRRRGPGFDWALIRLTAPGLVDRIEIDTNHFKGNYPDTWMVEGILAADDASAAAGTFTEIVPRTKMQPHTRHFFDEEIAARGPFSHVRVNVYPDGGISRLRVWGAVSREGGAQARIGRLNTLLAEDAERELFACCASSSWARAVASQRPFADRAALEAVADRVWGGLTPADWEEAFRAHPRIGERHARPGTSAQAEDWAKQEQDGASGAEAATLAALAEKNLAYEARFGRVYLVCATGKSAAEMLGILEQRLGNTAEAELPIAAEEQRKITAIRIGKMLNP